MNHNHILWQNLCANIQYLSCAKYICRAWHSSPFYYVFNPLSVNVLTHRNLAHWEWCVIILFIARNWHYATTAASEDDFVVLSGLGLSKFENKSKEGFTCSHYPCHPGVFQIVLLQIVLEANIKRISSMTTTLVWRDDEIYVDASMLTRYPLANLYSRDGSGR